MPEEFDPAQVLTASRFCDVVMKGGVTSGVVYPRAITRLAMRYVFRSIGGTSVGAIVAALTAAAEYDRQVHGSANGFTLLRGLPEYLGVTSGGETRLRRQFRADDDAMRRQLDAALKLVGTAPLWKRALRFELQLAVSYAWVWLLFAVVLVLLSDPWAHDASIVRIVIAVVLALVFGVAALPIVYALRCKTAFEAHDFGWCHGHDAANDRAGAPALAPLTDWLADCVDAFAGIPPRSVPLTFGILRSMQIELQMITTCLTLQRPLQLPIADPATRPDLPPLYWLPEDFARYFPAYVIAHLTAVSEPHPAQPQYRTFPKPDDLPVIVAARMSLSFPLLLCALPLYAPTAAIDPDTQQRPLKRVWFSDGGLTSNMPIHLFDAPLPRWPTFALDLLGTDPKAGSVAMRAPHLLTGAFAPKNVFLESTVRADAVEPWERLDVEVNGRRTRGDVVAFGSAILDTARTWRDRMLGALPGYADRTIGIRLTADQGGLNLNMDSKTIDTLAQYGQRAAEALIARFDANVPDAPHWIGHRWTRYTATMAAATAWSGAYADGYAAFAGAPGQATYDALIRAAHGGATPGTPSASPPERPARAFVTPLDAARAAAISKHVARYGASGAGPRFDGAAPDPHAALRAQAAF